MNLIGHREWRQKVILHYGYMEEFPDARTVRIMLGFLHEHVDEEVEMRSLLTEHPEELANWLEHSEPDLQECLGYIKELEGWLNDRGLVAR